MPLSCTQKSHCKQLRLNQRLSDSPAGHKTRIIVANNNEAATKSTYLWNKSTILPIYPQIMAICGQIVVNGHNIAPIVATTMQKYDQMSDKNRKWSRFERKCDRMCYRKENKVISNHHIIRGLRSVGGKTYLIINKLQNTVISNPRSLRGLRPLVPKDKANRSRFRAIS